MMDRSKEQELFLKYLSDIYLQNPDLPILSETIYYELAKFTIANQEHFIKFESLIGVQVRLNNKYKNNSSVDTFTSSDGNFWAIENRMGKNDHEFLSDMYNAIKLYIPVSSDNIYKISESLFDFMIDEGIVMQCKVAKEMRNDALVCRVRTKENALKVSDYVNSLDYISNIRPNPFLYDDGSVCMTIDGVLSYNTVLANVLREYLNNKRMSHTLNRTNILEFNTFINSQIELSNGNLNKAYMDLYKISSGEQYKDFMTILKLVSGVLDGSLTSEELFDYQSICSDVVEKNQVNYFVQDETKILYVINTLATYYSVDYVHKIIMTFIETGDYNLFTRKYGEHGGIRNIMVNSFSPLETKNIISDIGWKALIFAAKVTYDKYGEEQLFDAIKNVFNGDGIIEFTNDNEARSRLGLVIPLQLLREVITCKLNERGMSISSMSLMELVLEEINKLDNKKKYGRK